MKFKVILLIGLIGMQTVLIGQQAIKNQIITGVVRDTGRKPVKNASIYVDGKETLVITDSLGRFTLTLSKKAKRIKVVSESEGEGESLIGGYPNVNIIVTGKDRTMGKNFGNKTSSNQAKQKRFSFYTNIYEMIRSEVPGVQVEGNNIVLRGTRTFGGSNAMLLVVDGIPVDNINNIIALDVKSFSVIKGPEAASYGMRGANGVLIIETLRGTDKK